MTTLKPVIRQSKVLAPDGKPVSLYLYPTPRTNPKNYKPRQWLAPTTKQNFSEYDRLEMVNLSRQLISQIDTLDAAVDDKNCWAFGDAWDVHYTGANAAWGEAMEDFINNVWMPNCNVRGPQYDFKTSMKLMGVAWDRDGDDAMILTESEAGFPLIAFYPATRICTTGSIAGYVPRGTTRTPSPLRGERAGVRGLPYGVSYVQGGPFDGARIFDGIIMDRNGRAIGLRIIDEEGNHTDISAFNADLAYEPKWCDQGRGIPRIAASLLKWMSLQEIDDFIQRGIKRASAVGLLIKNAEGEAATGNELHTEEVDPDATGTSPEGLDVSERTVTYEELDGGETYYLSAAEGEEITGLTYKNPHPNVEAAIERITRGSLRSIGWALELINLSSTGRAPSRILCDLANQSIWSRQKTGYRRWRRAVGYAVAKAMKTGYLRKNDDMVDALSFEPGLPKPLQVDAGNDAQADREALKMGMTNRAIIMQKWHGMHYRQVDKQREMEIKLTIEAAQRIADESSGKVSFDRALELLEQRSPNPVAQNAAPARQSAGPKAEPQRSTSSQAPGETIHLQLHQPPQKPAGKKRVQVVRDDRGCITGYELVEETTN